MLRRVALVRTDVSEELSASFIRVTRIGELGTTLAVTSLIYYVGTFLERMMKATRKLRLAKRQRRSKPGTFQYESGRYNAV
jgi:hypothetical protein